MRAIFQCQLNHPIHAWSRRHLLISPRRRQCLQFNCSRPQCSQWRRKSHHSWPIRKKTGTRIHRHHKRLLQIVLYLNHPFLWSNCFNTDGIWGQLHKTACPTNTKRAMKTVTVFTKSCWTQCSYCPSPTFLKSQTIRQTSLKKGKLTPTTPVLATVKKRIRPITKKKRPPVNPPLPPWTPPKYYKESCFFPMPIFSYYLIY